MEPIIVIVGFMGAGKTTFLKWLIEKYVDDGWQPTLILNDYENASLDSQQFLSFLDPSYVQALSGSCICCSGITELRSQVNAIPRRKKGVTFIEANGTTDAVTLMEFLGVGISKDFLPPVQVSVVDVRNWQKRGFYNDLESNQVQVSSLVFLNHSQSVSRTRFNQVKEQIQNVNPTIAFRFWEGFNPFELVGLDASSNKGGGIDHLKTHWSSASASLPDPLPSAKLQEIMEALPDRLLRVKGCTRLDDDDYYTFFEKTPSDSEAMVRPYKGKLVSGPTILVVGPGSDPQLLKEIIYQT
ncbi:MAG: GTP-binding protein [Oligoflexales bacterium]